MKKIISILLVLILAVGLLVACTNLTEQQKAQNALEAYTLQQANTTVKDSFALPKTIEDFTVVWTVDKTTSLEIVDNGSNYTAKPICSNNEEAVILTATISTDDGVARRGFRLTIGTSGIIANNTEHFDEITRSFKLDKEYVGKNFWTDGVGEAVVDTNGLTDGDTTRFRLKVGNTTVTIRYYEIDTPESTGSVEKWGVAASGFNKKQLSAATEIVLESSTGGEPEHDSYGTRYLGYVWYRSSADEDFKCLNLEMVENGYSLNTGINTSKYPYFAVFKQAEDFAKSIKLRKHSDLDDPLYSKDPIDMTIKEFWENPDRFYNYEQVGEDEDGTTSVGVGSKVIFYAYLTDLKVGSSGTYTFTATEYNAEDDQTYSISVYTMYSNTLASSSLKIGDYYKISGTVQKYYDNWQISNISYNLIYNTPETTNTVQENYFLTFNSEFSADNFRLNWDTNLYSDATVTNVGEVVNGKLTFTAKAYQRKGKELFASTATIFTFTVTVPSNYDNSIVVGSTLMLTGLQVEQGSGNITVLKYSDITRITPPQAD